MRIFTPLLLSCLLTLSGGAAALADSLPATLTVTGTSVIAAVPDLATLQIGVTTNGTTAAEAMAANSKALAVVIARLQAAKIAPRDYQTSSLSLNPNWVNNAAGTASEIQGYTASNMLTVRVRAIDQVGTVLDAVISNGANALNSLSFGLQNPRPVEDEARKQAVADAVARATLIATAAGSKLGPVLSITEGGATGPMPGPEYSKFADAAVPVAQGEVEVSAAITMVFTLDE